MTYAAIAGAGSDYRSVSTSRTSRSRGDDGPKFPRLLRQVRPILMDWSAIRPGRACAVGLLVAELLEATQSKASAGELLERTAALWLALTHEQRTTRNPIRAVHVVGELDVTRRLEAEHRREFLRQATGVHTLITQLDTLVSRHNAIVRGLETGSVHGPTRRSDAGGIVIGTTTSLTSETAEQLATESIALVGPRTPADEQLRPAPVQLARGPRSWSVATPSGAALLAAEMTPKPAPYDTSGEVA